MKKAFLFVLLVSLLFLLSSCMCYSRNDVEEMKEQWDDKYYELEEQNIELYGDNEDLRMLLFDISESYGIASGYYIDHDSEITEKEAKHALDEIGEYLNKAGY